MYDNKNRLAPSLNEQTITSLELAELAGKSHSDLMKSIRKQEQAWKKVGEGNFSLAKYKDAQGKSRPMYSLNKFESLYVISKFNDEARARIIKRWFELETNQSQENGELVWLIQHIAQQRQALVSLGGKITQHRKKLSKLKRRKQQIESELANGIKTLGL